MKRTLYQYRSWGNNPHLHDLKNSIRQSKLWFNIVRNFNDPFDAFPCYKLNNDSLKTIKKLANIEGEEKLLPDDLKETLNSPSLLTKLPISQDRFSMDKYGIACFVEKYDNLLMWAHYADSHRGICMEYEIDNEFICDSDADKYEVIDIKYENTRPIFEFSNTTAQEQTKQYLSTKSKDWEYENEHRIMVYSKEKNFPGYLSYTPEKLKRVYIGANMSVKDFLDFFELCLEKSFSFDISIMYLDNEYYKLNAQTISKDQLRILSRNLKLLRVNNSELFNNVKLQLRSNCDNDCEEIWAMKIDAMTITEMKLFLSPMILCEDFCDKLEHPHLLNTTEKFNISLMNNYLCKEMWD